MFEFPFSPAGSAPAQDSANMQSPARRIAAMPLPALAGMGAISSLQAGASPARRAYPVGWVNTYLALNYAAAHRN